MAREAPMTAGEHPHGPPFTVERYGSFGQSVIAERDWLLEEVERLRNLLAKIGVAYCKTHGTEWQEGCRGCSEAERLTDDVEAPK
jgi:hypothetical protein